MRFHAATTVAANVVQAARHAVASALVQVVKAVVVQKAVVASATSVAVSVVQAAHHAAHVVKTLAQRQLVVVMHNH